MSTVVSIRMEVRGDQKAVNEFTNIDWQAEASGRGHGKLVGLPFVEWQFWETDLSYEVVCDMPVYSWHSKNPDSFLIELAKRWGDLFFVVTMWSENDDLIGTVVLHGDAKWLSFEADPSSRVPVIEGSINDPDEIPPEIGQEIAYEHYVKALRQADLEPIPVAGQ